MICICVDSVYAKISIMTKRKNIHGPYRGFTIVELLVVIVVIAILAAVSVVSYNGIQDRADTVNRMTEVTNWREVLGLYVALNGSLPSGFEKNKIYCLGTGFPVGAGGVPRCRDFNSSMTGYKESDNAAAMQQLEEVAKIPESKKIPVDQTVGPYIALPNYEEATITQVFSPKNDTCPSGMSQQWRTGRTLWCTMHLKYN